MKTSSLGKTGVTAGARGGVARSCGGRLGATFLGATGRLSHHHGNVLLAIDLIL